MDISTLVYSSCNDACLRLFCNASVLRCSFHRQAHSVSHDTDRRTSWVVGQLFYIFFTGLFTLELVKNPDIAAELGKVKGSRILVGFSAETDNLLENAALKLASKNMDMIVANDVTMEGAGFGVDTNIVKLIKRDGSRIDLPVMSKEGVAHRILDEVLSIKNG